MVIQNTAEKILYFGETAVKATVPEYIIPMIPFEIRLMTDWNESITYLVKNADGAVYAEGNLSPADGVYTLTAVPSGKLGTHTVCFARAGGETAEIPVELKTRTSVQTNDPTFEAFFESLKKTILAEIRTIRYNGKTYYQNKEWLRDHIHILKASRYWDTTSTGPLDFWIGFQFEDGYYPEIIVSNRDNHLNYIGDHCKVPLDEGRSLMRIEIEADIEFLMAQAIYQSWRANGNDEWMESVLPSLDKALMYNITDLKVWNAELGLAVRGVSVDTWDWVYGQIGGDGNRNIIDSTPMAVFYGDNTGLYQAFCYISEMHAHAGNDERAAFWKEQAEKLRENLLKIAWNGKYFAHMVHTKPTTEDAPEEWKEDFASDWTRLSLSNAYTLNRGFFTQEQAESVIGAFMNLRDNPPEAEVPMSPNTTGKKLFAEWITVCPPYHNRKAILYPAGMYANGSVGTFTAGELMRGAYIYGFEEYGTDIINRLIELYERDGELCFMYNQDGSIYDKKAETDKSGRPIGGGGPPGWGTAAIYDGIIGGLVGALDEGDQFRKLQLKPAWAATEYAEASTCVSYGESDNYVAYTMKHDADQKKLIYNFTGNAEEVEASILVPAGTTPVSVTVDGVPVEFAVGAKRDSHYADLTMKRTDLYHIDVIEVTYR